MAVTHSFSPLLFPGAAAHLLLTSTTTLRRSLSLSARFLRQEKERLAVIWRKVSNKRMLVKYSPATSCALSASSRHNCYHHHHHHRCNSVGASKTALFNSGVLRSERSVASSDYSPVSRVVCVRASVQEDSTSSSDM